MLLVLKSNWQRNFILFFSLFCFGVAQAQVPDAPTNLVVTPINTGGMIQFAAPSSIGGSAISNYEYSTDGGTNWVTPSPATTESPLIISSGLTNCTSYSIKIRAVNTSGSGSASASASLTPTASVNQGTNWTSRTAATVSSWRSVTYGKGLFVAVASNRVMTSADGINWTSRSSAANNNWYGVTYGNGLFVAVAISGSGNRVMTSPNGITWRSQTSAVDNQWTSVTYGNGLFVAVANNGTGDRVMTSPDGITWTSQTSAADNAWQSVTYGNGLFVAVAATGTGDRVMTSPDGITWSSQTSAADNEWVSVTHGNGLFVAVAQSGTGNQVMTSPDGITWTSRTSAANNSWYCVAFGNNQFVAVAYSGTGNRVMTSPDGINWTSRTSAADNYWYGVTYGNGLFVAVAVVGTDRVMTSTFSSAADAPVIISATLGTSTSINFTQTSSTYAPAITNYEYSTNNGINWSSLSPAVTTSPLTITGLASVPSSIMIRAVNSVGSSCSSNKYPFCTPTSYTETISACNSYTWHSTSYTASNNTATWTGTNAGGCDSVVTLNLTINTTPATPSVNVVNNCNGTSTLSTTASGTLLWSTTETASSIIVRSAGTYNVAQTVNGCVSASGSGVAAPINSTITITSQPSKSGVKVALNLVSSALPAYAVSATSNTALSYQWYSNSVASNSGGVLIPGATNASYVPSTSSAYTAYFYCVVSIQNSSCSVVSDVSEIFTVCP